MSNAKDRAIELIEKFTMDNTRDGERNGIKCALIAVDEILKAVDSDWSFMQKRIDYWNDVKKEINNL